MTDELETDRAASIDRDVLTELEHSIGDDPEFLRELIETYLEDSPNQMAAIRAGVISGDVEPVNRAAHTLKSNSGSVGAMTLAEMCRELEAMTPPASTEAADLAVPEIDHRVAAISAELDRVMTELDRLVPASSS